MTKSIIEITRASQWANKARSIAVYANSEKLAIIKNGESKTFEIPAGKTELFVKIDWCKTKSIKFEARESETYRFELGSNLEGNKLFYMSAYYLLFKPSEYLYLKDVEFVQENT